MSRKNARAKSGKWTTGLWGCLTDLESCCLTLCCPCITFGRLANILDHGKTSCFTGATIYMCLSLILCSCCHSCSYRSKLRYMFKLPASPCCCPDCMVHFCCKPCALCQEYRELENRGFNVAVGWEQNKQAPVNLGAAVTTTQTDPVPHVQMNLDLIVDPDDTDDAFCCS